MFSWVAIDSFAEKERARDGTPAAPVAPGSWSTALVRNPALWFLLRPILRRVQFLRQFGEDVAVRLTKLRFGQVLRRRKIRAR